jgi:hypothetical protein
MHKKHSLTTFLVYFVVVVHSSMTTMGSIVSILP